MIAFILLAFAATTAAGPQGPKQRPLRQFNVPTLVTTVTFGPDGALLALWDPAGFSTWDPASGRLKGREPLIARSCERSSVLPRSPDGRVVGAQCRDRLYFFEAATGRTLGDRQLPEKQAAAMYTASADGAVAALVMAGETSKVRVGRLAAGSAAPADLNIDGEVEHLSLSSSGNRVTIGTVKGVEVRDLPAGGPLRTLGGRASHALSADGRLLAIASDSGAQLFDADSGQLLREMEGRATSLRFSPDGKRLVGWTNQRVVTWDVASGAQQLVLTSDEFVDASISPDGGRLATVSLDRRGEGTTSIVAVWRLP